jgi:signal transduction histidine kinase
MLRPARLPGGGSETGFLTGGGEMARIIASFDWSRTPMGPIAGWSAAIRTTVGLMLRSPMPIVALFGEAGTMIYNDAYSVFAGRRHPQLLGSAVREGWPEVASFNDNVMKVGLAGGTLSYRDQLLVLYRKGAPEDVWLDLDYSPVPDEAGKPIGVIALVVEITSRVKAEHELRKSERRFREELEHQVAERTAALVRAEQTLRQTIKVEAIGNLTGGVAHDFNNLLMAVLGSMELLKKRMPQDPALIRLADNAMEGARRGASLTQRMLAFARKQELKPERVVLDQLVGGMAELMQRSLGPMVTVSITIPADLPPVEIDPNQLEAALLNLAVNARDAMSGEGPLTISARTQTGEPGGLAAGRYVCLSVADTGEGMDAETLAHATEPFFTTKGVGKGTGLGLSMVQGLAQQSGGALVLKSRPGEGTVAEIWLPVAPGVAQAARLPEESVPVPEGGRHLSILVVDDDALVLMNTAGMLEDLGHSVDAVGSAAEALERLKQQRYDLVVTDHAMPRMTGAQLVAEIRDHYAGLPVILATGYAELPAGMASDAPRLSKPFLQADLAEAVARAVWPAG